jgi:hypothetical protein
MMVAGPPVEMPMAMALNVAPCLSRLRIGSRESGFGANDFLAAFAALPACSLKRAHAGGRLEFEDQFARHAAEVRTHGAVGLAHEIESAQLQALERRDRPFVRQGRQHHDRTDVLVHDDLERGDAVYLGHVDVHADDVRPEFAGFLQTSSPSRAAPTSSNSGSDSITWRSVRRIKAESSATNTRMRFMEVIGQKSGRPQVAFRTLWDLGTLFLPLENLLHVQQNDHPLVAIHLADAGNILAIDRGGEEVGGGAMSLLARFNTSRTESTSNPVFTPPNSMMITRVRSSASF